MKKQLTMLAIMFANMLLGFSQQTPVKGVVSDALGPLLGVNIIIKGTTKGVTTDFDGKYTIDANMGDTLVFSYIGFDTQEVVVGASTINVTLVEGNVLEEVVVTAQGIKKEKKALGYAIANVDGEALENKPEPDVSRALQGKVAGVQISSSSGSSGKQTDITIRSNLSIDGNNSPLIVVDDVPFAGSLIDIDPNNIKSLSVLKGLNASVLYGSEGRNGVILIQTKSGSGQTGKKRLDVSFAQTTYINKVSGLPDYQNTYGQGSDFNFVAGNLGSWGPAFSNLNMVPHPYSGNSEFPEFDGLMVPYQAAKNNVKDFFREGIGTTSSLNVSSSQENTSFDLSMSYINEQGVIGNNDLKRFNLGVGGAIKINDKLSLNATLNFSSRKRNSYDEKELFNLLLYIPRSINVYDLPYQDSQGRNAYYRNDLNPNWLLNNTNNLDKVNRVFGKLNASYNFNDNIGLTYRVGFDSSNGHDFDYSNKGGIGSGFEFGFLNISNDERFVVDQTMILSANYDITDDFEFDAQLGINSKYIKETSNGSKNQNQIVYGFFRPDNFGARETSYEEEAVNLAGAFGQLGFSYKKYLYLNLSGRNDWGSTVEKQNQSLFYPGVSMSFIPTSAFNGFKSNAINYLKLRGAYATSSGYPGAYKTRSILVTNPVRFISPEYGNIISNASTRELSNPNLKPELHKEIELGVEGKFFNNRITLEASVFQRISENQILPANLPNEVGYSQTTINAGRVDTEGVELDLGIDIIKNDNFTWNFRNLFTAYETTVVDLPTGRISLGGDRWAIEGEPFGVFVEDYAMRDAQGNLLINPTTGFILESNDGGFSNEIIGDPTPDWTLTNLNSFTYKDFTLSAQLEYTHGGTNYSDLADDLIKRGVTRDTENREGSFIIPGVYGDLATGLPYLDANGNTIPNTIQISGNDVAFNHYYQADSNSTFDTSVFRIREIALGYNLRKKNFPNFPFESLAITLSGRNIFYKAPGFPKYTNIDPELDTSDGDTQTPTTSRYALSLIFKF